MALPFKKAGGGFLNNVTGVFLGIEFDTNLSGGEGEKAWRKLNAKLTFRPDGAEEPVETYVDGGFIYDENIEVDGALIKGTDECPVRENTELAGLIGSMVENGLDESEVGDGLDYSFIAGLRATTTKVKDEERNARSGRRVAKKNGKPVIGKDGKPVTYDHELLRVSKVFGREAVKAAKKTGGKKTTGAKATTTATAAPAGPNVDDAATTALLAIVEAAKDGKVAVSALSGAFVKYSVRNSIDQAEREPIRNRLVDTSFLQAQAEAGVIGFDGKVITATE